MTIGPTRDDMNGASALDAVATILPDLGAKIAERFARGVKKGFVQDD